MRRFSLFKRGNVFYVRLKDESTGKWSARISTGETEENAALATVYGWERDGIPSRDGRSTDSVAATRRIIDQLRTSQLSSEEARSIIDILSNRGLIVSAVLTGSVEDGPVAGYLNRPLAEYLEWFWDYDHSAYVKGKQQHGHSITRTHCDNRLRHIRNHWEPWLRTRNITLATMSRAVFDSFSAHIAAKGLASQTLNHILTAGTAALSYAYDVRAIRENPVDGIMFYSVTHAKRGTLTVDEIQALFAIEWPSEAAKLASLTAATTGLRAGEVAALQIEDIGVDRLHIRHSWSRSDGLKSTKTGESREVPLIPTVRKKLCAYAARNPHGGPYVFWSLNHADRPLSPRRFYDGLRDALAILDGVTAKEACAARRAKCSRREKREPDRRAQDAEDRYRESMDRWQARGISFHSWRHYFATTMAAVIDRRAMMITGHKSTAVFEHYANHATAEQFREVSSAATLAFSKVLQLNESSETTVDDAV